jgi:hypothetical protein
MPAAPDDWRLANGGNYLQDLVLFWRPYTQYRPDWDHDHCELCMAKFVETPQHDSDDLTEGYCTEDRYRWICRTCFDDFKDHYQWRASA